MNWFETFLRVVQFVDKFSEYFDLAIDYFTGVVSLKEDLYGFFHI